MSEADSASAPAPAEDEPEEQPAEPAQLKEWLPLHARRRLACGRNHTVYTDETGNAFVWGGGERAPKWTIARHRINKEMQDLEHLKKRFSQDNMRSRFSQDSMLPAEEDGDDDDSSAPALELHHLGIGEATGAFVPRPRSMLLGGVVVREVSAGPRHMLMMCDDGDVWSCGTGAHGRLGHGDEQDCQTPRRVENLQKHGGNVSRGRAVQISAGGSHSLVVTEFGRVISFGSGINGRHGHGFLSNVWFPKVIKSPPRKAPVAKVSPTRRPMDTVATEEEIPFKFEEIFIVEVEAGLSHSIAISDDGQMFTWGTGGSGQLGLGWVESNYQRTTPTKLDAFADFPIRQASAGAAHTLAVGRNSGELFSFGFGAYGRLGHGDRENVYEPKQVEGALVNNPVRFAAAGTDHSVVLTQRGQVFVFGSNDRGKLGLGCCATPTIPKQLGHSLEISHGAEAAAKAKKDALEVYAFGPNASTEFGEKGDVIIGAGQVQTFDTPQCIETLFNAAVVAIAAGHDHTAFMCRSTKNNALELRTCGSNDTGQLGLPWVIDQADKWAPTKVEMKDLYAAEHASALAKAAKLMALRRRERREDQKGIDLAVEIWGEVGGSPEKEKEDGAALDPKPPSGAAPPNVSPRGRPPGWYPVSRN